MKAKELRKKSDKELNELKKDLDFQFIRAKVMKGVKSQKQGKTNYGIFKELRKHRARILTILKERENE